MRTFLFAILAVIVLCPAGCRAGGDVVTQDTVMCKLLFPEGRWGLAGGDGAISIPLERGKSLWLWGDSFLGRITDGMRDPASRMVFGNIFLVLDGDSARTVYGGTVESPQAVVPGYTLDGKTTVYWPHQGFVEDGVLHLILSNIVFGGGGMWDFHCRALTYFRLSYPDFKVIDSVELASYPVNGVGYGYGIFRHKGHYYFYGNKVEGFSASLHVARAGFEDARLQDWEFFDGDGWNGDPSRTKALEGIDVGVSSQFSVLKHRGRYILLTQERGIGTNDIYTFVSDSPTGPWANKKKIYSTPEPKSNNNLFAYNAMGHPQYDRDGMLLVSYCLNTQKPSDNAADYRPRFIRVPYRLILE